MKSLRYREEHLKKTYPQFIHMTIDDSIFSLVTIFIVECLVRTKGSRDCNRLYTIFFEFMNQWNNIEGKKVLVNKLSKIMEKETLVSRFIELGENIKEIYRFSDDFMRQALGFNEDKPKTRVVLRKAAEVFNVYMKLNEMWFPSEYIGCQLIGYFGVFDKSLCLNYLKEMFEVDMSTRKRIEKHRLPFYFGQNQIISNFASKPSRLESNKETPGHTDLDIKSDKSIRYFDDMPEMLYRGVPFGLDISAIIESTCNRHTLVLFEASCGRKHCIECLYESIQAEAEFICCSCGIEVSEKKKKYIIERVESEIKDKEIEKFEKSRENCKKNKDFIEDKKYEDVNTESKIKIEKSLYSEKPKNMIPPPPLLNKKPKTAEESKINTSNYSTVKGLYSSNKQTCIICKREFDESEFQIPCICNTPSENSILHICMVCRSQITEKCLKCNQKYNFYSKIALEIFNLTKCANQNKT